MDLFSSALIGLNIAALTIRTVSLYKLVRGVTDVEEPNLNRIRIGLLTEFTRFRVWYHQTGISEEGELNYMQSRLSPDVRKTAEVIILLFRKWISRSVIQLKRYGIKYNTNDPFENPVKNEDLRNIDKRLVWRLEGFENLDEMFEAIQALNHGLEVICKPILSYDDDRINQSIKTFDELVAKLFTLEQLFVTKNVDSSFQSSSKLQKERTINSAMEPQHLQPQKISRVTKAMTGVPKKVRANAQSFSSQTVFEECLKLLSAVIGGLENNKEYRCLVKQVRSSGVRLKIWGCCVFVVPCHLDQLLSKELVKEKALRSSIVGILADLTLTIETFLEGLIDREQSSAREVLLRSQVVFSIHEDFFEESLDLPDELFEDSSSVEEFASKFVNEIVGLVDCLYQTIPILRRMQDIRYLELESQASTIITEMGSEGVRLEHLNIEVEVDKATRDIQLPEYQFEPVARVVETTAEMMVAIQLSIKEAKEEEAQKSADSVALDDAMKQIEDWERQIERIKAWSKTFNRLSPDQSSLEVRERNIKIVQTLSTLACDIASTLPKKDDFPIDMLLPQIAGLTKQLRKADRARVGNFTRDIKIKEESKSPAEALGAVQLANKVIEDEVGQLVIFNASEHDFGKPNRLGGLTIST